MEDTTPTTREPVVPTPPQPPEPRPVIHTFQSDMSRAMDTTEATAVQELLQTARDKETDEQEKVVVRHQRSWYTTGGIILIILALGAVAYGIYYYKHLTVHVVPSPSVGVFQSIDPIIVEGTDIQTALAALATDTTIPEGKPVLVPIIADATARAQLDTEALLNFVKFDPSEPFLATISLARLGVMNMGTSVSPFLIFSTPTPELATKEFLIDEPILLTKVAPVLGIDPTSDTRDIGKSFESVYMYNLPVRILKSTDVDTREETILLYYGYATDNTIVVATNPTVLKAIYDTIIRQR